MVLIYVNELVSFFESIAGCQVNGGEIDERTDDLHFLYRIL